jgi:hypothetical protein
MASCKDITNQQENRRIFGFKSIHYKSLLQTLQQQNCMLLKLRKIRFNSRPNQRQIHTKIYMNHLVTHSSNIFPIHISTFIPSSPLKFLVAKPIISRAHVSQVKNLEKIALQLKKLWFFSLQQCIMEAAVFTCVACGTCLFNNVEQ